MISSRLPDFLGVLTFHVPTVMIDLGNFRLLLAHVVFCLVFQYIT